MKRHKGQVIVEFALILPLLLLVLFGIMYSGMMFHDYSTLSNIARSSAREAAITGTTVAVGGRYGTIENDYIPQLDNLMTKFYVKSSSNPIVIEQATTESVRTTINMQRNVSGYFVDMILPQSFGVKYYMRKEPTDSSSSGGE